MPELVSPGSSARRRVGIQMLGIVGVATGVASTIRAEFGVAPYDVVSTGMHERLAIPIGVAAVLLPLFFIGAGLAVGGRNRIGVGTLLDVALIGPVLGIALLVIPEGQAIAARFGLFATGFVLITIGIVFVIIPDLGAGPAEVLMLAIADRGHALAPARTAIEVGSVAIGFALGGQVGVGTLVFAVLIGPALRRGLTFVGYDATLAATRSDAATPGA